MVKAFEELEDVRETYRPATAADVPRSLAERVLNLFPDYTVAKDRTHVWAMAATFAVT